MGRYNFAAQNVHKHAGQLLHAKRLPNPPPWYNIIETTPPSTRLTRPVMQREQKPGAIPSKRRSRMFRPVNLRYEQDRLRWAFFNDHPWELARPRVILEDDGRDYEKWDWSLPLDHSLNRPKAGQKDRFGRDKSEMWDVERREQSGRPINGESVIQRQHYLMRQDHTLSSTGAYDQARKEMYRQRHANEVEIRVAREEALAVGAYFGKGPLEIGMDLEDRSYEEWRVWAKKEIEALKAFHGSAYSGMEEEAVLDANEPDQAELQEVSGRIPSSRAGQSALGGTAVHP